MSSREKSITTECASLILVNVIDSVSRALIDIRLQYKLYRCVSMCICVRVCNLYSCVFFCWLHFRAKYIIMYKPNEFNLMARRTNSRTNGTVSMATYLPGHVGS